MISSAHNFGKALPYSPRQAPPPNAATSPAESGFKTLSWKHFSQGQSVDSWPRFNISQRFFSSVSHSVSIAPPAPALLTQGKFTDVSPILLYQDV